MLIIKKLTPKNSLECHNCSRTSNSRRAVHHNAFVRVQVVEEPQWSKLVGWNSAIGPFFPVEVSHSLSGVSFGVHSKSRFGQTAIFQKFNVHEFDSGPIAALYLHLLKFAKMNSKICTPKTDPILRPILLAFRTAHFHAIAEHNHSLNLFLHDHGPKIVHRPAQWSLSANEAPFT